MVRNTLSNWIANAIYVAKGKKLSFKGRKWMPAIFDTPARRRLCKMSRQVGKSTSGSAESLARIAMTDAFTVLYVAPERDQAKKYSNDKVKPMIKESGILKKMLSDLDNIHEKEFHSGGKLFLKYAKHSPDSCRGITADMIHYDEIQDQDLTELEPVINESLFTSEYKLRLYTGTPKSFANPIHKKWTESDQREWIVRCHHHTPVKWIRLGMKQIGKKGPTCHHCGNLLDVDDGVWVAHNPGADTAGFHVHQLHCKISHRTQLEWDEILFKFENYPESRFLNEVLGESADTAETPITQSLLYNLSDPKVPNSMEPSTNLMGGPVYAGVDWGHSGKFATALVLGTWIGDKFKYIYMKTYEGSQADQRYCIPDMMRIFERFNVERVHCDYGGGFGMNSMLDIEMAKLGKRRAVTTNMWSGSAKARDMRWDTSHEIPNLTMNKQKHISDYINTMHRGKVSFPAWGDFNPIYSMHFLNVRKEVSYDDKGKEVTYFTRIGQDDIFQACIYAWIIAKAAKKSAQSSYRM